MAWVLDHKRDLMADFRAIYHLSPGEASQIPFPEYLALAYRAPAFQGVMAHRLMEAETERQKPRVKTERQAIMADPILSDAISFS